MRLIDRRRALYPGFRRQQATSILPVPRLSAIFHASLQASLPSFTLSSIAFFKLLCYGSHRFNMFSPLSVAENSELAMGNLYFEKINGNLAVSWDETPRSFAIPKASAQDIFPSEARSLTALEIF